MEGMRGLRELVQALEGWVTINGNHVLIGDDDYKVTGKSLGQLYHGGPTVITTIDVTKLNQRDAGFYGAGFYVSKSADYAKTYGNRISRFMLADDAKVLVASLSPKEASAELVKIIMADQERFIRDAVKGRGKVVDEFAMKWELNEIANDHTSWAHAVDGYAIRHGFDAIKYSDGEIVVKNAGALRTIQKGKA
jgi:hypothetical protein